MKRKTKAQPLSKPDIKEQTKVATSTKVEANDVKNPVEPESYKSSRANKFEYKVSVKKPVALENDSDSESEVKAPAKNAPVQSKKLAKEESSEDDSESEEEVKPVKEAPVKPAKITKMVESPGEDSVNEEENKPKVQSIPAAKELSDEDGEYTLNKMWAKVYIEHAVVSKAKPLYDIKNKNPSGVALFIFPTKESAQAYSEDVSNFMLDGRLLTSKLSDIIRDNNKSPKYEFSKTRGNREGEPIGKNNIGSEKHTVFVGNLGFKTNENSVKKFFAECGNVIDVRIDKSEGGKSKGYCHVDFKSAESLEKAKSKAGQSLDGRAIRVEPCNPRRGGGSGDPGGREYLGTVRGSSNPINKAKRQEP